MEWKIAVVDDLESDRSRLEWDLLNLLAGEKTPPEIHLYESAGAMLAQFRPGFVQLAFLDICMEEQTGIELAQQLRELDRKLLIVFLSTSREFAFDAFPVHPFDYLVKPYTPEMLRQLLSEAQRSLAQEAPEITLRVSRAEYRVPLGSIIAAVAQGHAVEVSTTEGQTLRSLMTFSEIHELLAEHKQFLLCNRGVLVNMDHVLSLNGDSLQMDNGSSYALRTKGRTALITQFSQYQISRIKGGRF